ncbi:uncharacterized protein [Epargyreus clarus]|uniref:uncharacterized protein n=1 Tax=Epargyreus clarus TaxID=520877 RepID=UPI003C308ACA
MALRRMAARRGWPVKMYSDNGTNFRGADAEISRSFAALDKRAVQEKASHRGVEWSFIPPGSPHIGGAWERLIRAVKTALRVVLKKRALREETLLTLLAEVEGTSSPSPTPGSFNNDDFYLRRQWRIAQRLTDMFWQRWIKEVLPVLTPRPKWCTDEQTIKAGDLVLVVDPNLPRNTWP